MTLKDQRFFLELSKEIGNHPDKQEILADYEMHVYEMLQEESIDDQNLYSELVKRLGTPQEIAQIWKQETTITPKKTQWLFVLINAGIFIGGVLLTLSYNIFHWNWAELLWENLINIPFIIMLLYIMFWGLIGYEIGKEFGHGGYRLLQKTFLFSIVPNILFMYLIIFKIIPYTWFQPLLSFRFIVVCIVFTAFLYPVSMVGYRWGKKVSV